MTQILFQILNFRLREHKIVVAVHEQKWCLEQIWIGQFHLAFLLDLEGGCARDKLHEVLAHAATIVAIVRAVPYPAHEEGGLFVVAGLGVSGESQREQQREDHGRGA